MKKLEIMNVEKIRENIKSKKIIESLKTKKAIAYMAIVVILIAGVIVFRNIGPWAEKQNDRQVSGSSAISIEVEKVKTMQMLPVSTYDATLLAREEGAVGANVPGKVIQITFKEGATVTKGTPLIILDSQDISDQLKAAQAQLTAVKAGLPKAEANISVSQRNYENAKALFEAEAISKNDMTDAETALKVAQADLEALKANIQVAQQGVVRLQHSLDNMVIKAPLDGIVDEKNVEVGQYVNPGVPLAKVKNISGVDAVIKIAQDDVQKITIGQKAQVRISGDSQVYDGTVSYISTAANTASRTFICKVAVPNKDNRIKPGIYAKVAITGSSKVSVLVIPLKAVAGSEGSYYVFTDENGVARRNDVTLGETYNDLIEVKSGLDGGASVISTNINSLRDGDPVAVISEQGE